VRDGEKGPVEIEMASRRVQTRQERKCTGPEEWLVVTRCPLADEGMVDGYTSPEQTPPRHPCHQWELKRTGSSREKSPLGTRHFPPYTHLMYYML